MPDAVRTETDSVLLLVKSWRLMVLAAAVAAAVAVAVSALQPNQYSATANLLFRDPGFDQKLFGNNFASQGVDTDRQASTNVELAQSEGIAQATARVLRHPGGAEGVRKNIAIKPAGESDVVAVTATLRDPRAAAHLANTYVNQYVAFRRNADKRTLEVAIASLRQQLAEGNKNRLDPDEASTLRTRLGQLQVLRTLQTGNAEVVQAATPPSDRSSPHPLRNGVLGAGVGLLAGAALIVGRRRLDRRVREPEDFAALTGSAILVTIPHSPDLKLDAPVLAGGGIAEEAFALLRARLAYVDVDNPPRVFMVTSAAPGEGKSTVALNLARVVATRSRARVLLVETDLRRPVLATRLGLTSPPSLPEVLSTRGDEAVDFAKYATSVTPTDASWQGTLDVVVAGSPPPNPGGLLGSESMLRFIDDARRSYDIVVVDTAPVLAVADALPLVRLTDAVILVGRVGISNRKAVSAVAESLRQVDAPVAGIAVNDAKVRTGSYQYYGAYDANVQTNA
jgi:capsular exopolysaccharide synthesis family protein